MSNIIPYVKILYLMSKYYTEYPGILYLLYQILSQKYIGIRHNMFFFALLSTLSMTCWWWWGWWYWQSRDKCDRGGGSALEVFRLTCITYHKNLKGAHSLRQTNHWITITVYNCAYWRLKSLFEWDSRTHI